jgi:hypothetical protein
MATISTEPRVDGLHDFAVWQMRLERWRRVRHLLDRAELAVGRLRRECVQAAASELSLLLDGEVLWSFPGPMRFVQLRRAIDEEEVAGAALAARRIVRLLELYGDAAAVAERDLSWTSRYITVLLVADDAAERAPALHEALAAERRDDDARDYALVPLASIEEALVAVRCNPWVEAVLLGNRVLRFARHATLLLTVDERRGLGAITGPDPVAVSWLEEQLRAMRASLILLPAHAPPPELHGRLAR